MYVLMLKSRIQYKFTIYMYWCNSVATLFCLSIFQNIGVSIIQERTLPILFTVMKVNHVCRYIQTIRYDLCYYIVLNSPNNIILCS